MAQLLATVAGHAAAFDAPTNFVQLIAKSISSRQLSVSTV
jgi:hypothetical protein